MAIDLERQSITIGPTPARSSNSSLLLYTSVCNDSEQHRSTHTHTHTHSEWEKTSNILLSLHQVCEFATKSKVSMMFTCNISLVTDHLSASLRLLQSDTAVSFSGLIGFYSVTALVAAFILCSLIQLANICQRPVHTALTGKACKHWSDRRLQ